jgi:putative membrane protein
METTLEAPKRKEPYKKLIIAVSVVIPVVVAVLFGVKVPGYDLSFLPPIYASINGVTAVLLVAAVIAIKNGNRKLHERLMKTCILLSILFLVMYVLYHMTSDSTPFGGEGAIRYVYFFILISHILLSVIIIPMVLFTYIG